MKKISYRAFLEVRKEESCGESKENSPAQELGLKGRSETIRIINEHLHLAFLCL
jgi:hypothetical protein